MPITFCHQGIVVPQHVIVITGSASRLNIPVSLQVTRPVAGKLRMPVNRIGPYTSVSRLVIITTSASCSDAYATKAKDRKVSASKIPTKMEGAAKYPAG